jgi:tetratricopeptide (TPR) repeat protein
MMIEQHYDEEVLAGFLAEPIDSAARDKHLAGCSLCKRTLESIRDTAGLLKQGEVWERQSFSSTPRPETLAFLRGVQKTMAGEDAAAEIYVKQLLAGSRDTWASRLAEHPEWRTAGLVRKLIAATDRAIDVMPADAVEITKMAVEVAGHLALASTRSDDLFRLRGNSWYEHAYALMYTGAYVDALDALSNAESEFTRARIADHEIARVNVVRAMLYRAVERVNDALPVVTAAAVVFQRYGDGERYYAARLAEGITLYSARRFSEALRIHLQIAAQETIAPRWRASALQNAAMCHREMGDLDAAIGCFTQAIAAFEAAGMMSFRAKTRWTLARIFLSRQQYQAALQMFIELRGEFEELGMANEVALVALDVADVLLATGEHAGIADACRQSIAYFEKAQLTSSEGALTAVTYLCEAAVAGTATSTLVSHLRTAFLTETKRAQPRTQPYEFS